MSPAVPKTSVLLEGLRFGMVLQLSIGPVCLLVFSVAGASFPAALLAVAAVTLVDALYVILAVTGVAAALKKPRLRRPLACLSAAVLVIFGLAVALGALGLNILPRLSLPDWSQGSGAFLQALLLTLSSPLTIVFWAGVFSGRLASQGYGRRGVFVFAAGCLAATPLFLTAIAALGTLTTAFLPAWAIGGLNLLVGLVLVFFGVRMLKKEVLSSGPPPA